MNTTNLSVAEELVSRSSPSLNVEMFAGLEVVSADRAQARSQYLQHDISAAVLGHSKISERDFPDSENENKEKPKEESLNDAKDKETIFDILKVASSGNLDELIRLVNLTPTRLYVQDYRGLNIVHYAVQRSQIAILDYLYLFVDIYLVDLNDQDKLGNTPLHLAVDRNEIKALDWLLSHGSDMRVKNILNQAPIHLAVEQDNIECVERILDEDPEIVDFRGDIGYTPLLYACKFDRPEIARVLLERGADLMSYCDIGYSAIHSATRNGASKSVDVLIEHGESLGISKQELIHTIDKENYLPLHAAVNSGSLKAVQVCLESDADISMPHAEDKQTAVHFAAVKGAVELLKALFEAQPKRVEHCVGQRDILDQTPLHKAAMFNHYAVVEYLLEMGSSMNTQDDERRTPLVIAASKNAVQVINHLISVRANASLKDKNNRNFIHMAVLCGTKLKSLDLDKVKNLKQLLNERDDFGSTPMHYASKAGQLATLKQILQQGGNATVRDNKKQNPLHVAARYGRIQVCKSLLASEYGEMLINEIDSEGHNAIHIAAQFGQARIISTLLIRGSQLKRDFILNTPLHLAAQYGNYEATVLLLNLAPHLLNQQNRDGNTALHLSAQNGHALIVDLLLGTEAEIALNVNGATFLDLAILKGQSDATAALIRHERCEEVMNSPSLFGKSIIGMIQFLPEVCLMFLDKCMSYSGDNRKSRNFNVQYKFHHLITPENIKGQTFETVGKPTPIWPLNMMVRYDRVNCLAHPLCLTFLSQKWNAYGTLVYNFRLFFYVIALILLTTICYDGDKAYGEYLKKTKLEIGNDTFRQAGNGTLESFNLNIFKNGLFIRMLLAASYSIFSIGLSGVSLYNEGIRFFFQFMNWFELSFYASILVLTAPSLIGWQSTSAMYISSAIVLFLGWVNFCFHMQRFTFFGLYIVMFQEIFKTLMRALSVYSFVLIAFALSMTQVFRTYSGRMVDFINPFQTFLTLMPMMWGDSNFEEYVVPSVIKHETMQTLYPMLMYFIYFWFIILAGILCKNILIGLAVGNIESVQKNARLKRLATQVTYFTSLEQRLPGFFLKSREFLEFKFYPNKKVNRVAEFIKTLAGNSKAGKIGEEGSKEVVGAGFMSEEEEFQYLQQEISKQGRQLRALVQRYELHRELMKVISNNFEQYVFIKGRQGKPVEREIESGDEDENEGDNATAGGKNQDNDDSNTFCPAASSAQWHAINKRIAKLRKPKTNIWVSTDS